MSYVTVDSCMKCGSPMYAPAVWYGITPAPLTRTCGCYDWAKSVTEEYIPEKSQTERELVTLLSDYVGETGESESAVEVLSRLLTELEMYRDERRKKREAGV